MFRAAVQIQFRVVPPQAEYEIDNNCVRHDQFTLLSDLTSDSLIDNAISNSLMILSKIVHVSFMSITGSADIKDHWHNPLHHLID